MKQDGKGGDIIMTESEFDQLLEYMKFLEGIRERLISDNNKLRAANCPLPEDLNENWKH